MSIRTFALIISMAAAPCSAANLTAVSISVNDVSGIPRTTFTSGERIALRQAVSVAVSDTGGNPIKFKFIIVRPSGGDFTHTGNEAPGTAGGAQSQVALPIASFYTVPGQYTYRAEATLSAETVTQTTAFTISSPNITLIYPPYGARQLSDKPLIFRWAASGASRYRVTVSDNAGLYNALHTGTNSGESTYTYPEAPTQPREQLVPDQVYYWKVEGLDSSNNVISESSIYNFSLKAQASAQSRNVMVSALDLSSPALDFEKPMNFKATLMNTGSATESNISVRLTLGGIPAQDSPKSVASIGPGERQDLAFTAFMPAGQDEGLAVACADLFDDNVPDNCKTKLVSKNAGAAAGPAKKLSYDEMFQEILKRLGPEAAAMLEGYTFSSLSCGNCSQDELAAIMAALISGDAQLVNAAVLDGGGAAASSGGATAAASAAADSGEAGMPEETALDISPLAPENLDEWSGFTEPQGDKAPATFVITGRKEWKRVWKLLSSEDAPDVDFDAKMVVGIIAARGDRAQTVRLMGKRKTDDGIAFDYYVIEAPSGEEPPSSAYVFKVYDKDSAKAEFKRLDVR